MVMTRAMVSVVKVVSASSFSSSCCVNCCCRRSSVFQRVALMSESVVVSVLNEGGLIVVGVGMFLGMVVVLLSKVVVVEFLSIFWLSKGVSGGK